VDHGGLIAIVRGLVKICWFVTKWGLLAGVIGLAISIPYLYRLLDSTIQRRLEARFAEHYPDLKVRIRSAELVRGEGIRLRGLSVFDPAAQGPRAELLMVEEVFLACCADLDKLLTQEPEVTRVVIRRPTLRATRRLDGTWSTARLLPLPRFRQQGCEVLIDNGMIEISDARKSTPGTLTLREVNLNLRPIDSVAQAAPAPGVRRVEGSFTGELLQRVELEGLIDLDRGQWDISGVVEGLQVCPEMREALPAEWAARLVHFGPLRGLAKLGFRLVHDPASQTPYHFDVTGELAEGRWDDPRLTHPLTDLSARIRADNAGFAVEGLSARSGQSTLRLSCRAAGYEANSPVWISAEARQLDLDPRIVQILPASLRNAWEKYSPSGQIHAQLKLHYDGQTWHPEADIECLKVSFCHCLFPYRIEHARGSLELRGDVLSTNLLGYSGMRPVSVRAQVQEPFSRPYGWLEAQGDDLQIDEKLLGALREPSRSVVCSLDPHGTFHAALRIWRERPDGPVRRHLVVTPNRCWIRYEKFPYPLTNIRGTLEMLDGAWSFRNLEATNDAGVITGAGRLVPLSEPNRWELALALHGSNVALSEQLRDALRPDMQRLWSALRPRGTVDLDVDIRYATGGSGFDVAVRAEPRANTASIEPIAFPYRMEKLSGVMQYRAGRVLLENVRAEHGNVRMAADGLCELRPEGGWRLRLDRFSMDRVRPDRDLMQALPERLKRAIIALNFSSPVNLAGSLEFRRGAELTSPLLAAWDLNVHFAQASVEFGVKVENINGAVRLLGDYDGQLARCRGELSIDSAQWKNFQFTQVLGPLWIDDEQVRFGSWVEPPRADEAVATAWPASEGSQPVVRPRPVTAQLLGGTVSADAWISLEAEPRYRLQANLVQADLNRFARENLTDKQDLHGRIAATVDLHGMGKSLNGLGGRGVIQLRDADVYELPLMIRLLRILSIRRPSPAGFSSSDINFRIQGTHIYLDRIDFSSDAFSLIGQGDMNFQTELRLTFHAQVGRGRLQMPLLQEVLGGASKQLMLIYVRGTLQDPEVTRQALPAVKDAIQQFQGAPDKPGIPGLLPQARLWGRVPKPR